jgi:hypothetical protein
MKRFLLCVALLLSALAGESNAQWWGGGYGLSNYYNRGIYVDQDRVPYFSLHPPVYYSYPVPRPYGYSPFAYPGYVPTPHYETKESGVLLNPYVNENAAPSGESQTPTDAPAVKPKKSGSLLSRPVSQKLGKAGPLRITNPFYDLNQVATGR